MCASNHFRNDTQTSRVLTANDFNGKPKRMECAARIDTGREASDQIQAGFRTVEVAYRRSRCTKVNLPPTIDRLPLKRLGSKVKQLQPHAVGIDHIRQGSIG